MRNPIWILVLLLTSELSAGAVDSCEKLALLKIPHTTIASAQNVSAGSFTGPAEPYSGRDLSTLYKTLPGFCRVTAEAKPTADSDIRIEVWLPLSGWNGKLRGVGNGGFAGQIDTRQLAAAVKAGYAATATNTGHSGSPVDAAWALGHPEKVVDFGHRGIHEMTLVAKAVVQSFYAKPPRRSYFMGCSDGGREALMEAQRYPEDYDGIVAGAPANYWTRLLALAAADTQALTRDPASFIPEPKIATIAAAVNAACDKLDGVQDGILNDPRQCHFDPASIQCKAEDSDKCLTAAQVTSLKKLYAGLRDSHGDQLFPGYVPGGEEGPGGWGRWITGPEPGKSLMAAFAVGYWSNMVFEKPNWDYKTFDLDPALKAAEEKTADAVNATNPDLDRFKDRGGKLILYHGWNDPAITPLNTINYYTSIIAKMGQRDVESFVRLYMLPGVQHCGGGPGPDSLTELGNSGAGDHRHHMDAILERWVEQGIAPSALIAAKAETGDPQHSTMTRPLCPYPQEAKYKGKGDTNDAANFSCEK